MLSVKVKPRLALVKKRLELARKKLKNTTAPHKEISLMLDAWVQKNFKSEGGKVGGWEPLKAGGRYKKSGFDPIAKILQDTGRLRLSFAPFSDRRGAGIGSDINYAPKHEEGIDAPKRRMLPISQEVRKDIFKMYEKWVNKAIKAAKL